MHATTAQMREAGQIADAMISLYRSGQSKESAWGRLVYRLGTLPRELAQQTRMTVHSRVWWIDEQAQRGRDEKMRAWLESVSKPINLTLLETNE